MNQILMNVINESDTAWSYLLVIQIVVNNWNIDKFYEILIYIGCITKK